MGTRLLEIGVVIATALSAGLLALMLAAPLLPQPSGLQAMPSVSPRPTASAATEPALPPIGMFLMRNAFSFGPCLAIELEPRSYPVAEGAEGVATVLWWQRGMTGCDARSGEVTSIEARTHVVPDSNDPEGPPVGYRLEFSLPPFDNLGPIEDAEPVGVSLTILTRQSTDTVLQAIEDAPGSGQGYVLDRVPVVDPPLNPLPTPPPTSGGPTGLYLHSGPFTTEGACLAIQLTSEAYPIDPEVPGTATILWWEHAGQDSDDPAVCYSRSGDMHEVVATVVAVPDEANARGAYAVRFSAPIPGVASDGVEFAIDAERSNRDRLEGVRVMPAGETPMVFDRVDELNPPLASPSAAPAP